MDQTDPQLRDIVTVIESLYNEREPSKISAIQTYLQDIQKSNNGLKLADELLSNSSYSLNCKFFGASTYIVNLNRYKTDHSKLDIDSILSKLLFHLTTLLNDYRFNNVNNSLVIEKILQCLSIIFNSYSVDHQQWKSPLSSLVQILLTNKSPENITEHLEIDQYLPNILSDNLSTQLLLQFSSIISDDLTRIGNDKVDFALHEAVQLYVYRSTKALIISVFESNNDILIKKALETFNVWVQYISFAQSSTSARYNDLNDILQYLVLFLTKYPIDSEIYQITLNLITEIFENNPFLFDVELRNKIGELFASDWSTSKVNEYFQHESIDELENFVSLIIAYYDIDTIKFASNLFRPENSGLLTFLLNLTNLPLKPIIEENVSKKFVEVWNKVSEILVFETDKLSSTLKDDTQLIELIKNNSKSTLGEISKIYFNKISLSISSDLEFKENAIEFLSFRDDLADLFDSIYSNIGTPLYQNLINNIINNQDINQIETSLFLLGSISFNFSSDTVAESILESLDTLFQSNFLISYSNLLTSNTNEYNRHFYLKTIVRFLGSVGFFYQSNRYGGKYLNSIIDFLFNFLKLYGSEQSHICKIILQICDTCRSQLVESVPKFETILVEMFSNQSIESYTREKLVNSISCIIQSIPNPALQTNHVSQIIQLIENAAQPYLVEASRSSLSDKDFQYVFSLLSSVHELAKGLQIPEDFEESNPALFQSLKDYYVSNPSASVEIQQKIINFINVFTIEIEQFTMNTLVNEVVTQIYKTGLLEDFGPFSFSSTAVLEYVFKKSAKLTPTTYGHLLEMLITLFNVGLQTRSPPHQQISNSEASNIIKLFVIDRWDSIRDDPDLVLNSVNLFSSIVQKKPALFISERDSFEFIIKTATSLLYSREKFVLKSTSKFWVGLLTPKKLNESEAEVMRNFIDNDIGGILTYNVFSALVGALRSDIECYGNIVVLLLVRHTLRFKEWATSSLDRIHQERLAKGEKGLEDHQMFLKKLLLTRGSARKGNDLVKEFWIACNGTVSFRVL